MSESFLTNYKAKHQHPLNRLSHSIGIPMIVVSLPLFLFNWRPAGFFSLLDILSKETNPRSSKTLSTC
jgi:uncharacterized membrane protein YGL010W